MRKPYSAGRVPKQDDDHIFMYPVSHSANLEEHSMTVRFAKGSMSFIAEGLKETIRGNVTGREGEAESRAIYSRHLLT
jgi:hypothetical protein